MDNLTRHQRKLERQIDQADGKNIMDPVAKPLSKPLAVQPPPPRPRAPVPPPTSSPRPHIERDTSEFNRPGPTRQRFERDTSEFGAHMIGKMEQPKGYHKYIGREPDGKGGWRYKYKHTVTGEESERDPVQHMHEVMSTLHSTSHHTKDKTPNGAISSLRAVHEHAESLKPGEKKKLAGDIRKHLAAARVHARNMQNLESRHAIGEGTYAPAAGREITREHTLRARGVRDELEKVVHKLSGAAEKREQRQAAEAEDKKKLEAEPGTKKKIKVARGDGKPGDEVDAHAHGDFAYHPSLKELERPATISEMVSGERKHKEHTVTHVPTGMSLGSFPSAAKASAYAKHMHEKLGDSTKDMEFGKPPAGEGMSRMLEAHRAFKKSEEVDAIDALAVLSKALLTRGDLIKKKRPILDKPFDKKAQAKKAKKKHKAGKAVHPVSEAQRRWAFAAEQRGELPRGKALEWSRRAKAGISGKMTGKAEPGTPPPKPGSEGAPGSGGFQGQTTTTMGNGSFTGTSGVPASKRSPWPNPHPASARPANPYPNRTIDRTPASDPYLRSRRDTPGYVHGERVPRNLRVIPMNRSTDAIDQLVSLVKAEGGVRANHKYVTRRPDGKGGWSYVYQHEHSIEGGSGRENEQEVDARTHISHQLEQASQDARGGRGLSPEFHEAMVHARHEAKHDPSVMKVLQSHHRSLKNPKRSHLGLDALGIHHKRIRYEVGRAIEDAGEGARAQARVRAGIKAKERRAAAKPDAGSGKTWTPAPGNEDPLARHKGMEHYGSGALSTGERFSEEGHPSEHRLAYDTLKGTPGYPGGAHKLSPRGLHHAAKWAARAGDEGALKEISTELTKYKHVPDGSVGRHLEGARDISTDYGASGKHASKAHRTSGTEKSMNAFDDLLKACGMKGKKDGKGKGYQLPEWLAKLHAKLSGKVGEVPPPAMSPLKPQTSVSTTAGTTGTRVHLTPDDMGKKNDDNPKGAGRTDLGMMTKKSLPEATAMAEELAKMEALFKSRGIPLDFSPDGRVSVSKPGGYEQLPPEFRPARAPAAPTAMFVDDTQNPFEQLYLQKSLGQRLSSLYADEVPPTNVNDGCLIHGTRDLTKAQGLAHPYAKCTCR